jgi:lysozyme
VPLYGIDISGYQAGIDLSVVPCDFVGIYVSGGVYSGNAHMLEQVQAAIANGKRLILYHFENDGTPGTGAQEAAWFLTVVHHLEDTLGRLPANTLYALDNETGNARNIGWQQVWLDTVRVDRGAGVGMYAPFTNIADGIYQPLRDAGYFLWESAYILGAQRVYGYQPPAGRSPIPGGDPAIWQFTPSLVLPGWQGLLDGDVFFGGPADWDALAGATGTAASTVTPIVTDPEAQFLIKLFGKA